VLLLLWHIFIPASGLVKTDSLQQVASHEWLAIVQGAKEYAGWHKLNITCFQRGLSVRSESRIRHLLVNSNTNEFMLMSKQTNIDDASSGCWPAINGLLPYLHDALTASWSKVMKTLGASGMTDVLAAWNVTEHQALMDKLRPSQQVASLSRVFEELARTVAGCHPGVERITACARLPALLSVRANAAFRRPLFRIASHGWASKPSWRAPRWPKRHFHPRFWAAAIGVLPLTKLVFAPLPKARG